MGAVDVLDDALPALGPDPARDELAALRAEVAALRADLGQLGPRLDALAGLADELRPLIAQLAGGKLGAVLRALATTR